MLFVDLNQVMDALNMEFPDNSFDMVWACESGEHMPDKKAYVAEMARVLKPGGLMVVATWCQREETPERPFSEKELKRLDYLYAEWTHPHFISIEEYGRLMEDTGVLSEIHTEDWWAQTIASWVSAYRTLLLSYPLFFFAIRAPSDIITMDVLHLQIAALHLGGSFRPVASCP